MMSANDLVGAKNSEYKENEKYAISETTYTDLMSNAKSLYIEGNITESLKLLKYLFKNCPSEKLQNKIDKIQTVLASKSKLHADDHSALPKRNLYNEKNDTESLRQKFSNISCTNLQNKLEKTGIQEVTNHQKPYAATKRKTVVICDDFAIPERLFEKLYPHQKEGVTWLCKLVKSSPGGILADDMGLGKTIQLIAFLTAALARREHHGRSATVLIAMPVSVLITWQSELTQWAPHLNWFAFHDQSRAIRLRRMAEIQRRGGIILTTYGMLQSGARDLATDLNADPQYLTTTELKKTSDFTPHTVPFTWDYVILDEAHKVKNPSAKTTKALRSIPSHRRILLTGTAVQNNLRELWTLYDYTHQGRLLGTQKTFLMEYEKPITRAREKDATRCERTHGQLMATSLKNMIKPYFLRRTKNEVFLVKNSPSTVTDSARQSDLPAKTELVVWIYLSEVQESIYRDFIQSDRVREFFLRDNRRSPLIELTILKKLCDHPRLLSPQQCASLALEASSDVRLMSGNLAASYSVENFPPAEQLIMESHKLGFLIDLLESFLDEPDSELCTKASIENRQFSKFHRTIVFSQSLRLLNILEFILKNRNSLRRQSGCSSGKRLIPHKVARLDGRLTKIEERTRVIKRFEDDHSYTVMLLTSQVSHVTLRLRNINKYFQACGCHNEITKICFDAPKSFTTHHLTSLAAVILSTELPTLESNNQARQLVSRELL